MKKLGMKKQGMKQLREIALVLASGKAKGTSIHPRDTGMDGNIIFLHLGDGTSVALKRPAGSPSGGQWSLHFVDGEREITAEQNGILEQAFLKLHGL